MPGCRGRWISIVNDQDDGVLDLDTNIHYLPGGNATDRIRQSVCGLGVMLIVKDGHIYDGILVRGGAAGLKHRRFRKRKPLDEPTDGSWTAQGPIIIKKGRKSAKKASRKPAKATVKSRKTKKAAAKK